MAVTAVTAKTPLHVTCTRRSPGPAAVTAKTPKMGLEITAATCAPHYGQQSREVIALPATRQQLDMAAPGQIQLTVVRLDRATENYGPVVRPPITMLCTWGRGRPWGLVWCSKEATTQRWGLTGENRVRPVPCMNSSTA